MYWCLMFLDMMNQVRVSDLSPLNHRRVLYSRGALYSEESVSADEAHFSCSWAWRLQSWLVVCPLVVIVGTSFMLTLIKNLFMQKSFVQTFAMYFFFMAYLFFLVCCLIIIIFLFFCFFCFTWANCDFYFVQTIDMHI